MLAYSGAQPAFDTTSVSPSAPSLPDALPSLAAFRPRRHDPLSVSQGVVMKTRDISVGSGASACCVAANGYIFVANTSAGTVSVINPSDWSILKTITVGTSPRGICYAAGINRVYVTCGDSKVYVIDPDAAGAPAVVGTITVNAMSPPFFICWVPTQNCLYVGYLGGSGTGVVQITSLIGTGGTAGSVVTTANTSPDGVCYVPSVNRVYTTNGNGPSMNVINPATNTSVATVSNGAGSLTANPNGMAYCPLNDRLYVACGGTAPGTGSEIAIINPNTNSCVAVITVSSAQPQGICFNPENGLLYVTVSGATPGLLIVNPVNNTVYTCAEPNVLANAGVLPTFIPHVGYVAIPHSAGTVSIYT